MTVQDKLPPLQLPPSANPDEAIRGLRSALLNWSTRVRNLLNRPILGGLTTYTVANLPTAPPTAAFAYASNGRKVGEGVGAGTGVPAYKSADGTWRRLSDDTVVVA